MLQIVNNYKYFNHCQSLGTLNFSIKIGSKVLLIFIKKTQSKRPRGVLFIMFQMTIIGPYDQMEDKAHDGCPTKGRAHAFHFQELHLLAVLYINCTCKHMKL